MNFNGLVKKEQDKIIEELQDARIDNYAQTCNCEKRISELEESMKRQFQVLGRALAEQKAMVAQLLKEREVDKQEHTQEFPIKTDEELVKINEEIEYGDRNGYKETMKMLLGPQGVTKNLKFIITDEMTATYNVDGILGKKCLKRFNFFYDALVESIPFGEDGTPEEQLRKAMKLQKKRFAKKPPA